MTKAPDTTYSNENSKKAEEALSLSFFEKKKEK